MGGAALDPRTGVIYVNANGVAWTGMLAEVTPSSGVARATIRCSVRLAMDWIARDRRPRFLL